MKKKTFLTSLLTALALTANAQTSAPPVSCTIEWDPNDPINLAGYVVAMSTNGYNFTTNNTIMEYSPLITNTNYFWTNLTFGVRYFFAVQAISSVDNIASDWSDTVDYDTRKPKRPSGVHRKSKVNGREVDVIIKIK